MDRRAFLRLSGVAAAGVAGASVLAACTGRTESPPVDAPAISAGIRNPITLPIDPANPAIESGLAPEKGATLKVLEWREYLSHSVVKDFEDAPERWLDGEPQNPDRGDDRLA